MVINNTNKMNIFKKFIGLFKKSKKESKVVSNYYGTTVRESLKDVLPVVEVSEFEFKSNPIPTLKKCFPYEYWSSSDVLDWLNDKDNSRDSYEQFFENAVFDFSDSLSECSLTDLERFQFGGHSLIFKYKVKDETVTTFYWGLEG